MKNEERKIEIILDDGTKKTGDILFTFEANGDNFILYELEETLFAAKSDEHGNLSQVEEDEWKLVEEIYEQYQEDNEELEGENK